MQAVTATFRNGQVELTEAVDWPEGTRLEVVPRGAPDNSQPAAPMTEWPDGFFDRLRGKWGDEPFERPPQGELERREDW
ncbi:MAG: hypothetical protein O3C40_03880 [Planctomycetota bacterium]|nr:hypothetical protein [Planctomycetota bacterium]